MANPVRSVKLVTDGAAQWVDEALTDPVTGKAVQVKNWTLEQLQSTASQMTAQYNTNIGNLNQMMALLTPSAPAQ